MNFLILKVYIGINYFKKNILRHFKKMTNINYSLIKWACEIKEPSKTCLWFTTQLVKNKIGYIPSNLNRLPPLVVSTGDAIRGHNSNYGKERAGHCHSIALANLPTFVDVAVDWLLNDVMIASSNRSFTNTCSRCKILIYLT